MADRQLLLHKINTQCLMKPPDLCLPEYMYSVEYDFKKRKPKPFTQRDMTDRTRRAECEKAIQEYNFQLGLVSTVIAALLNTSGGVIILWNNPPADHKSLDEWRNNLSQYMPYISRRIFDEAISLCVREGSVHGFIKHSPVLITTRSHLYMRTTEAVSTECYDEDHLRDIMTRHSVKPPSHVNYEGLNYGDIVGPETQHLEYKDWNVSDAESFMCELKNNIKALLGLANVDGGGDLVIGIQEDRNSRQNTVRGVCLSEGDRMVLMVDLEGFINTLIFGDRNVIPTAQNWCMEFIDVANCPPEEDRTLVVIHMFHCKGGLFAKEPECCYVRDDGQISLMSFRDWKKRMIHSGQEPSDYPTEYADGDMDASVSSSDEPPANSEGYVTSQQAVAPVIPQRPISTEDPNKDLSDASFAADDSWRKYLEGSDYLDAPSDLAVQLEIPESTPIHFMPSPDKLAHMCVQNSVKGFFNYSDVLKALSCIQDQHRELTGYAWSFLSWQETFDHNAQINVPIEHIADMFIKTFNELKMVVLFHDNQSALHEFSYLLCRILKKYILTEESRTNRDKVTNIVLIPYLYNIFSRSLIPCLIQSEIISDYKKTFCSAVEGITNENFNRDLGHLLQHKETSVSDRLGNMKNLKLTEMQAQCFLRAVDSRFNLIEGAPGAGKSVLVSYITERYSRQHGKEKVLCICPKRPFASFLEYQGKCIVRQVDGDDALLYVAKHIADSEYLIILVDDAQGIPCKAKTWYIFYKSVLQSRSQSIPTKFFILLDSKFQAYGHLEHAHVVKMSFTEFCKKHNLLPSIFSLRKILRNRRKVFAFMKALILKKQTGDGADFICFQVDDGKDVRFTMVPNLWQNEKYNGLIQCLLQLIYPDDGKIGYEPSDIIVLTDKSKDAMFLRTVCSTHLPVPLKDNIQDATIFPPKGITIETTENIIGLEALVCLHVSKKNPVKESFHDTCYQVFIASRGIDLVRFLSPKSIPVKTALAIGYTTRSVTSALLESDRELPRLVIGKESDKVEFGRKVHVYGVSLLADGKVAVCDHNKLLLYSPQGHLILSQELTAAIDVASTDDGGMVAASRYMIYKLDRDMKKLWHVERWQFTPAHIHHGEGEKIRGVCTDYKGIVYARLGKSVCVVSSDGKVLRHLRSNVPVPRTAYCSVVVQPWGDILIPDTANHCVVVLTASGEFKSKIGGPSTQGGHLSVPVCVAVDREGNVAVTNIDTDTVTVYSPSGKYIKSWGHEGKTRGLFSGPTAIDISHSGDIIVCDKGNQRMMIF